MHIRILRCVRGRSLHPLSPPPRGHIYLLQYSNALIAPLRRLRTLCPFQSLLSSELCAEISITDSSEGMHTAVSCANHA